MSSPRRYTGGEDRIDRITGSAVSRRAHFSTESVTKPASQAHLRWPSAPSVGRGLHELVEEIHADLLVVGSSRRALLGRAGVGDDTRAALNGAPCAIAIAPAGYGQRAGGPEEHRSGIRRIAGEQARTDNGPIARYASVGAGCRHSKPCGYRDTCLSDLRRTRTPYSRTCWPRPGQKSPPRRRRTACRLRSPGRRAGALQRLARSAGHWLAQLRTARTTYPRRHVSAAGAQLPLPSARAAESDA